MNKKVLAMLLAGLVLFTSASAASMEFTVGGTALKVEKEGEIEEKALEAAPFINAESRTMVPVRAISEAFGAEVGWDENSRTVTVKKDGVEIKLVIDKNEATVNGEVKKLDTCPVIVADRTMVPLRFIGEALSCNVQYASVTKQILIDDSEPVLSCGDQTFSFAEFKALYDVFYLGNLENATSSGMDDAAYGQLVAQIALKTAENMLWMKSAYPAAVLSAEDIEELRPMTEETAAVLTGLDGYLALIFEKNHIASGKPVLRLVQATEDVKAFYEENYVLAKHVLVFDEASANMIYEKAVSGADFDILVAENGQDTGMLTNPEGYVFTKGEMVAEFEEATFAAAIGEITKPVKSEFGYHVIQRLPLPAFSAEQAELVSARIANAKLEQTEKPKVVMETETLYEKLGVNTK